MINRGRRSVSQRDFLTYPLWIEILKEKFAFVENVSFNSNENRNEDRQVYFNLISNQISGLNGKATD